MKDSPLWNAWLGCRKLSTDSRKIEKGSIFFALKGEKFNGNLFAEEALRLGAAWVVVDEDIPALQKDSRVIHTENVLSSLQALAREWRKTFSFPVLGISGSNGKTTTKELVRSVLSTTFSTQATAGNLNNHIGVPLTLLSLTSSVGISVVEMGANKPGDIKEVAEIALPTHGLMTNVGYTHLDGMGSLEGVEKTEGELYGFLREHGGFAFVNEADPGVLRQSAGISARLTYGGPNSDFRIHGFTENREGMVVTIHSDKLKVPLLLKSRMTGRHNALNILAATTVGWHFGLSPENIAEGIWNYLPSNNRSQWMQKGGRTILLDAYNANPSSMQVSVQGFLDLHPEKPALILGDMFELGEMSGELHAEMGKFLARFPEEVRLILVGPEMKRAAESCGRNAYWFESTEKALEGAANALENTQTLLIKGSRGMALERLLDKI